MVEAQDNAKSENGGEDVSKTSNPPVPAEEKKNELSVLDEMKKENLEMQEEIKTRERLLARRDELRAREMLGGKGAAGIPEKPKEETAEEYADRIMNGKYKKR